MRVGAMTHIGQVRAINQDAFLVKESLVAVADGMGGHQAGEVASGLAMEVLDGWAFDPQHPELTLHEALNTANERIFGAAGKDPNMAGMGTTLSLAWFVGEKAHIAHIGDSRVYEFCQGKLHQLTWDHSVVGELVRNGALGEAEALRHPQRNVLTRSLGTSPTVDIDLHEVVLPLDCGLLLCTDGLHSLVAGVEMETLIKGIADPQIAVQKLVTLANRRGGHDNITALLVFP